MLKLCDDCGEEKDHNPHEPARTKANGFYGWHCWDCHRQEALGRFYKRKREAQSPEYVSLHAEVEALQQRIKVLKAAMLKIQLDAQQAVQQAREQARSARPKVLSKRALSLPYGELVRTAQSTLDTFLQEPAIDSPAYALRKRNLEYKLEYAQKKLDLFGPDAFDVRAKE